MTTPAIRSFKPEDLPALHKVRNAAFVPVFQSLRALAKEAAPYGLANAEKEQGAYLDTLCGPEDAHQVFVATEGNQVIGFIAITLDHDKKLGTIGLAAVDPDHDSHGIGTVLSEHALDVMKEAGMKAAEVSTGGDPSHAPARRAYEKAGFETPPLPSVTYFKTL